MSFDSRWRSAQKEFKAAVEAKHTRHTDFWDWCKEHKNDFYWDSYMRGVEESERDDYERGLYDE